MKRLFRRQRALVKLIYEVQNETASSAQLRELADRLRHDPEAQKLYVFLMDMHASRHSRTLRRSSGLLLV